MQKRTREIIALVLLIVLGVGGIAAISWYMFVGHNWNEAASNIDDRVGDMGGYTVYLFEGVVPSEYERYRVSSSQPMLDEQNRGELSQEGDRESGDAPLSVGEAAESYRDKGAQVVVIDATRPQDYQDPVIVSKGGKRIAVFAATGPRPDFAARNIEKSLDAYDVDFTVCLVDDYEATKRGMGNAHVVICTDFDDAGNGGHYIGSTYVLGSPYVGSVKAVLVSPSGFISSKTLDSV